MDPSEIRYERTHPPVDPAPAYRVRDVRDDDVPALTRLLHTAYAELGEQGLNFTAVDQSEATTA